MITIHNMDCLEGLRMISECSIDSIVTDPPYGLSFMGKRWDYDVPTVEVWAECLRVLKPGGHLLAFAGTRTQHRMAVRIEDAGFEIRDMIAWVYGSGFPKSLDVSKALDKKRGDNEAASAVADKLLDALKRTGKSRALIDQHFGTVNVSQYWFSPHRNAQVPPHDKWPWLREFLELKDQELDAEVWRLNGRKGQPGEAWHEREVVGQSDATRLAVAPGQDNDRSATTLDITAPATDAARQWQGWGTALKPALEPITVARKPLIGTVAQNVLTHGTGAINVDGCRVGYQSEEDKSKALAGDAFKRKNTSDKGWSRPWMEDKEKVAAMNAASKERAQQGRWPANLIHDGSDEVVECFPESKGQLAAVGPQHGAKTSVNAYGDFGPRDNFEPRRDTGSAARFFYCAKASKKDRDEGLEAMPTVTADPYGQHRGRRMEGNDTRIDGKPPAQGKNHHPTVKPTDLMAYLCRLVTPPGGIVLDPFMGSGSTGKAAAREGFAFVGIERDQEYFEIARGRIEHVSRQIQLFGGIA